jgi:hypothetical protein
LITDQKPEGGFKVEKDKRSEVKKNANVGQKCT